MVDLTSLLGILTSAVSSNTVRSAVAAFLVAVVGPKLGLDQTTALQIAGGISVISVAFLRVGISKAQQAAEASGVTQATVDTITKVVGDVVASKIPAAPINP